MTSGSGRPLGGRFDLLGVLWNLQVEDAPVGTEAQLDEGADEVPDDFYGLILDPAAQVLISFGHSFSRAMALVARFPPFYLHPCPFRRRIAGR